MTDMSESYADLHARYSDSHREAGWGLGFTFPAHSPHCGTCAVQPPAILDALPLLARLD